MRSQIFEKYNAILRAGVADFFKSVLASQGVRSNRYEATLHVLTAAITKLGKLTQVSVVYRAPGRALPASFWQHARDGLAGIIETGCLSTSSDKEVALQYARRSKAKLLFELRLGFVARGADIGRFGLSQYPAEAEILMPPCTALQAVESVIEKDLVIVCFRPTLPPPTRVRTGADDLVRFDLARLEAQQAAAREAAKAEAKAAAAREEEEAQARKVASDEAARQWRESMAASRLKALEVETTRLREQEAERARADVTERLKGAAASTIQQFARKGDEAAQAAQAAESADAVQAAHRESVLELKMQLSEAERAAEAARREARQSEDELSKANERAAQANQTLKWTLIGNRATGSSTGGGAQAKAGAAAAGTTQAAGKAAAAGAGGPGLPEEATVPESAAAAVAKEMAAVEKRLAELRLRQQKGGGEGGGGEGGGGGGALPPEEQAEIAQLERRLDLLRQTMATLTDAGEEVGRGGEGAGSSPDAAEVESRSSGKTSDPRIPPGGSVGPKGEILDAAGKPVLGPNGTPLIAASLPVAAGADRAADPAAAAAAAVKAAELVVSLERVVELLSDATPETDEEWAAYLRVVIDAMAAAPQSLSVQQLGVTALACLMGEVDRPTKDGGSPERSEALRKLAVEAGTAEVISAASAVLPKVAQANIAMTWQTLNAKPKPKPPKPVYVPPPAAPAPLKKAPTSANMAENDAPPEEPPGGSKVFIDDDGQEIEVGEDFLVFDSHALQRELSKNKVKTLEFFRQVDKDGSGELSKKEFTAAVRMLGFETVPKADIDAVFLLIDPDKSGKITYEELDKSMRKLNQELAKNKEKEKKEKAAAAKKKKKAA